ncbi:hypothetical protein Tco_1464114, partial [Tanacetum coccineum]
MCFSPLNAQLSTLNSATKFPQHGVGLPAAAKATNLDSIVELV